MRRLITIAVLICGVSGGVETQRKPAGDATLVYTGEKAKGIYLFRLQPEGDEVFQNVTLVPLGLVADTPNPSFIELDLKRRLLFAVHEVDEGAVSAYSIDPAGRLTLLNQRPSMGKRPCHLALDAQGRHLLIANCGSGTVAVLPVGADGRIGDATDVVERAGNSVAMDPESRYAFASDPGSDTVRAYRFDAQQGKLTPSATVVPIDAGAGPRQMAFRQDGRFAYVVNEKKSTITVFAYDAATGALSGVQTASTVPEYFDGPNVAGELWIHRSGKWLYASNSGHNSVVLFTIDKDKTRGTGSGAPT